MARAKKSTTGIAPLPHYAMPDQSESPYELILEQLQEYENSRVGSSYFYISEIDQECRLCRIVHGGGRIFFHELVDHGKHGISDEDLEDAVRKSTGSIELPGHYIISPLIEQKLRILYEG